MPTESSPALFISDLHLAEDLPETSRRFLDWLETVASGAESLYILGDLFDAWPGDDYLSEPFPASICLALKRLGNQGTRLFAMHGNRDFLLGEAFRRASGTTLLPDPSIINLANRQAILLHGDTLCTDDLAYQQFRQQVRNPAWQQAILVRPLAERRALAKEMRAQSESNKEGKLMAIMDINQQAADELFRSTGCSLMIHGHTHRPTCHERLVDNQACQRWVLPDWHASHGGYLRCDEKQCRLIRF